MPRSTELLAAPDPAPTIPATMSYSAVLAALRDKSRCADCGKTRVVLNIAGHRQSFRAEKVDPRTHCACPPDGPAYTAPAAAPETIEVCERCGQDRERVEFYNDPDCRDPGEWIAGVHFPGPSVGAHVFVRVARDSNAPPPALGVER